MVFLLPVTPDNAHSSFTLVKFDHVYMRVVVTMLILDGVEPSAVRLIGVLLNARHVLIAPLCKVCRPFLLIPSGYEVAAKMEVWGS